MLLKRETPFVRSGEARLARNPHVQRRKQWKWRNKALDYLNIVGKGKEKKINRDVIHIPTLLIQLEWNPTQYVCIANRCLQKR